VLNDVDAKHAGSASGLLNAVQQVAVRSAIALIGVVFFGQLSHNAASSFTTVESGLRTQLTTQHVSAIAQNNIVKGLKTCFIDRSKARIERDATKL